MESQIAISVVVPAYNAEKVVANCIESILAQTLTNIEIIAVEDGSKDATREVLRQLALKDSRIRIIEKDVNEGLSAGRNSALKLARGEYIGFVDADDWVEKEYFETLYREGKHSDLIVTGYKHDTMDEERERTNITRSVRMGAGCWNKKEDIIAQAAYVDTAKMFAYTWNKLYKRKLILENELMFSNQVLIEDFIFNALLWNRISTLSVVDYAGYHYVKASKDALTQKFLPDFLQIMELRFKYIRELAIKNRVYRGNVKTQIANIYIKHAIAGVVRNCSPQGNYSFKEQYKKAKTLINSKYSKEAIKNAKGLSKQEKVCNLVFKSRQPILVLLFGKTIYLLQTKSKTAFDRIK
ncbi:glycosyltransferase family 2 protein [Roseburia hominis]